MTIAIGTELPAVELAAVSAEKMKTMAALLADPTPIHFDVAAVRALGMGERPINQGPLNMGYVMNAVCGWAGGADRLRRLRVRFVGTVHAGQGLRVRGVVTELVDDGTGRLAELNVWLETTGPSPVTVLSGTATMLLGEPA